MNASEPTARLLIVDDEAAQMTALCQTLQDEGYETVGFTSGRAALAALKERSFDLLLTDLMMPTMDGITLLSACQQTDPNLVAVVMTGHGAIETAVQAMQAGALDYIQKPFRLRHILPVLKRALTIGRLRRTNALLEERVRERTAQLELANKELEAFSYSVSHDLRAPLRVINGYAEILSQECHALLPANGQKALDSISSSAHRMGELINDLLELAQLSRQSLAITRIATTELVREVLDDLAQEQDSSRLDLELQPLPVCRADRSLLRQVFVNLLSNALKFSAHRDRPRIEIHGRQDANEVIFSVRDNGAGFDMSESGKLFGVFQRLHSAAEFEGTGIGLSIVQRIVARHGGRVWAEGERDRGATFYFALPS